MKKITRWGSDRPGWSTVSKMSIPLAYADHHYRHMPKISLGIHRGGRHFVDIFIVFKDRTPSFFVGPPKIRKHIESNSEGKTVGAIRVWIL